MHVVTSGGLDSGMTKLFVHRYAVVMVANYIELPSVPHDAIVVAPTPKTMKERSFLSAVELC
jgi:hypothetical protein